MVYNLAMNTSRADYTSPEWNTLQTAVIGTGFYIRKLTPNLFEGWKAKKVAESIIDETEEKSSDAFFRQLCDEQDFKSLVPRYLPRDFGTMEVPVLQAIDASIDILTAKDPAKLNDFKNLILYIAEATADSVHGTSHKEEQAIENIRQVLNNHKNMGDLSDLTKPFDFELNSQVTK